MNRDSEKKVVTRFAPSPTGYMHMGGVRTAIFAYLFARKNAGTFILRIEDTDKERSKKEYEDGILDAMKWLKLDYDALYRQSERGSVYRKYIEALIKEDKAYLSQETEVKEGGRAEVIRFRNPNKIVKFQDIIRGEISFNTTELGDFVIAKSLEEPIFHLAVVVDDFEMGITHVIRGEDHISNTPRHILLFEALGAPIPTFAHLPLVLAGDRTKLSKRKHGEMVSLEYYRKQGYLPQAIINFMALIGWNPGDEAELFSLAELIEVFDLSKVQKGGAVFNIEKLNWFNKHYMQKLSAEEKIGYLESAKPGVLSAEQLKILKVNPKIIELISERASTFGDILAFITAGEFDYFFGKPVYKKEALLWKGEGDLSKIRERLVGVQGLIESISPAAFTKEIVKETLWPYAEKEGRGSVLWPLRVSLSGKEKSPDPFVLAEMLGKEETLSRLEDSLNLLS